MQIVDKNINDLIFAEYNPRQLMKDEYKQLKDSITRFGLVDPIIVNKNEERKNIIVGGHQRVRIAKDMKIKEVPCVEVDLTLDKERELNIRLNKNSGSWDYDALANMFDTDELTDWGFAEDELVGFDLDNEIELFKEEEIPENIYKESWREWAKEINEQYKKLLGFTGITTAYAKICFLKSKYKNTDYPRHCSLAFHPHQFLTKGDRYSVYEGLDRVATNEAKTERLMFITNDNPKISSLTGGSLAFASARLPLDFPAKLAKKLINKYAVDGKVLDPCFGWGGRLVGFLLSDAKYYYGIDVSPDQFRGVDKIKKTFLPYVENKKVELECIAFEDNTLKQKFNFAITSPPYFDVEKYIGGEQSHDKYDNYDIWKENFYQVLIERVYDLLYDEGVFALQVGSQRYPLLKDGKQIAEQVGFTVEDDLSAEIDNTFHQTEDEKKERIIILRKNG